MRSAPLLPWGYVTVDKINFTRTPPPPAAPRHVSRAHCCMPFAAPGTARMGSAGDNPFCELFPCLGGFCNNRLRPIAMSRLATPCSGDSWAPQLLEEGARQHVLVRCARRLARIASRLPQRLSRRVLRRGKGMSTFGPFPPFVRLFGCPFGSLSAPPLRVPPPARRESVLGVVACQLGQHLHQ